MNQPNGSYCHLYCHATKVAKMYSQSKIKLANNPGFCHSYLITVFFLFGIKVFWVLELHYTNRMLNVAMRWVSCGLHIQSTCFSLYLLPVLQICIMESTGCTVTMDEWTKNTGSLLTLKKLWLLLGYEKSKCNKRISDFCDGHQRYNNHSSQHTLSRPALCVAFECLSV